MNCSEAEQLFDPYLDGQLGGSLRLELDAHRLRCRRCQQTLALMDACAHVLTADRGEPDLSQDFTERVMTDVARRRLIPGRLRSTRVAVTVGFVLQAAAVLLIAIIFQSESAPPGVDLPSPPEPLPLVAADQPAAPDDGVGFAELMPRPAGDTMLAAVSNPLRQFQGLLGFINVPESSSVGRIWGGSPAEDDDSHAESADQYSL